MRFRSIGLITLLVSFVFAGKVSATLITNSPQTITKRVRVQVIDVANDDGSNAAPMFGSAAQQVAIFAGIGTI